MEAPLVQISGPGGGPYRLGQPMLMFAGQVFLGRVDPVVVSNGGADVHFETFAPTSVVQDEPRNVGALLLYEACAHIAHFHPRVQMISFDLSRPIPSEGDPAMQASARVAVVERIGTTDIQVKAAQSGKIVVSGAWIYNESNLRALEQALEEHRAMFREVAIGRGRRWPRWLRRLLRRR
ncbi:hypothetical protein QTH91_15510 [Variovorax dokdonensis]|uniref:Uncharacterized protein n=1 Tax=Variovorax dokdonensis TaxID=344883 RepID=A0ABT7NDG5_9BURK|nr:hypothetical protein [Variovorax dokdonensis]MDM0045895.1 hypothetical protein [Variovorax dokdonensis]